MAKCIILARVSTTQQSYEEQVKNLIEVADREGYKEDNRIIIENKESATKKNEEERLGLIELKKKIENDPDIDCVFCREVSRIGRTVKVLESIKNYLIEHKIQLVVTSPYARLLDDSTREVTMMGGFMFDLAKNIASFEMKEKQTRFKEGKDKAVNEKKSVTGIVLFGYTINKETKKIEVDESIRPTIERIFRDYTTTSKSTKAIYKELVDEEKVHQYNRDDSGANFIRRIIMNPAYSGGGNNNGEINGKRKKVYQYKYDAIVSEETQKKAIEKCLNAKRLPKHNHKNIYYAKSILKCVCGYTMVGEGTRGVYKCPQCRRNINLSIIDHIAWFTSIILKTEKDFTTRVETVKKYQKNIETNNKAIKKNEERLLELDDVEANTIESCRKMHNQAKARETQDKVLKENEKERRLLNQDTLRRKEQNRQMETYIKNTKNDSQDYAVTEPVAQITDDEKRQEIVKETVENLILEEIDNNHIKVSIIPNLEISDNYPFYYVYDKTKMPYIKLYKYYNGKFDGEATSLVEQRYHERRIAHWKIIRQKRKEKRQLLKGDKLSVSEIAAKYKIGTWGIYERIKKGILPAVMLKKSYYIEPNDAEKAFGKNLDKEKEH